MSGDCQGCPSLLSFQDEAIPSACSGHRNKTMAATLPIKNRYYLLQWWVLKRHNLN